MDRLLSLPVLFLLTSLALHAEVKRIEALPQTIFYSLAVRGDTVLAGTDTLLYVSTDCGTTWRSSGRIAPNFEYVDVIAITSCGWFVGSANGGVYYTNDGGMTWNPAADGLGTIGVTEFEEWEGKLYAATDGFGVYACSLPDYAEWNPVGTEFTQNEAQNVRAIHRHRNWLIASGGGNGYVFVKKRPDTAWIPVPLVPNQMPGPEAFDLASAGDVLIAATPYGAFQSGDGGLQWGLTGAILYSGIAAQLAVDGGTVYYAITKKPGMSDLYRSNNFDSAWEYLGAVPEVLKMNVCRGTLYMANLDGVSVYTSGVPSGVEQMPSAIVGGPSLASLPPLPSRGDQR